MASSSKARRSRGETRTPVGAATPAASEAPAGARAPAGKRKPAGRSLAGSDAVDLGSDKLYFKIGEVAEIVGVPAYVLRYWESEFKAIRPQKSRTQQRVYRRRDVVTLLRIKHLLYEQRFTIAGARVQLKEAGDEAPLAKPSGGYLARQSLQSALGMLEELRSFVGADEPMERNAADPSRYLSFPPGSSTQAK